MVFLGLLFTLLLGLTSLRAKYYSDCSPDKNLVSFAISACGEDKCEVAGGELIKLSIAFKPKILVHTGLAKFCMKNAHPIMCLTRVARIPDICEYISPKCPMEPGHVYTYEYYYRTPNVSIRVEPVYKLYDGNCNMIACVDFFGELKSVNTDLSQLTVVDDTQPCKN